MRSRTSGFGGPELTTRYLLFGRMIPLREGSLVLRDASGVVADSLNYGGLSDPWAAKGFQAQAGERSEGCFVAAPEPGARFGMTGNVGGLNRSAGRFPDGADTDSNCTDFSVAPATMLPLGSDAGSTTLKVVSVNGFHAGEKVLIGSGSDGEQEVIASVGTGGATTTSKEVPAGATTIPVAGPFGFGQGQIITIGSGAESETATIASINRFEGFAIVVAAPLKQAHTTGSQVSGSGLTLTSALTRAHAAWDQVVVNQPTPGTPNQSAQAEAASTDR